MSALVEHFWELDVYKESFDLQQRVFRVSQLWPKQENYALIDQVRRSSRSVGANLAEAWAKRRYPAHFLSKLTDSDGELQETRHWLSTADACAYLSPAVFAELCSRQEQVGRMLGNMISKHDRFAL
jgi:four helix bundle protein